MTRNIDSKDFNSKINELLSEGWIIEDIEKIEYFKVKLNRTMNEGATYIKERTKIPLLHLLNKVMLQDVSRRLNIKFDKEEGRHDLISKIEMYKKGVVVYAYETALKEKAGNK
jgi:hypothetical protein